MFENMLLIIILPFALYAIVMLSPPVLIYKLIRWVTRKEISRHHEIYFEED
jgi:hypothetical protein